MTSLFDHVGIVFSNLERGGDFYRAVLAELDIRLLEGPHAARAPRRYYCAFLIDFDGNNVEAGVYA